MSQIEMQDVLSETEVGTGDSDNLKLVPVAESIRYRKRAQVAEKKLEALAEELAQTKTDAAKISEQLKSIQTEQGIMRKLAAAGAVDLEAAVLITKARIESATRMADKDEPQADLDSVIEQLRKEKQYLFAGVGGTITAKKTAGAKDRITSGQTALDSAAKRAATTGSRIDLHRYLKLRRNFI